MSIVGTMKKDASGEISFDALQVEIDKQKGIKNELSTYDPSKEEKEIRSMILRHFTLGYTSQYTPRVEFNDLPVVYRDQVDWMAFNTYQPNNGDAAPGDQVNSWRSNAIKPTERNKCISIAAHATAHLVFPKVFAFDHQSQNQQNAAQVMMDLMEWSAEQSNYGYTSLEAIIAAEVAPASIVHTEYNEVMRTIKMKDEKGKIEEKQIIDETLSGFKDTVVPIDQLYISNFFEPDIQKQSWLVWRRVQDFQLLEAKYKNKYENFKYVRPGVQVVYNDANSLFYYVYDPNMRQYMGEEIIYWNRTMDLMIIMVNGVMLTDYNNPNPRNDKLFPFTKFGYELINTRCFYYKSLVFKLSQDAKIINTLYPMIIDGTYLSIMPPSSVSGGEMIGSNVYIPGAVTTLSSPDAKISPISNGSNLGAGMSTLQTVEQSINESSELPITGGARETAYTMSLKQQERQVLLGLFLQMIASFVKQFGKLRMGDIIQYLTIADVDKITDNPELVYKTFLLHNKKSEGKSTTRKIKFDKTLPSEPQSQDQVLQESYKTLEQEQSSGDDTELYRVNPELIRDLNYMVVVTPDVLSPLSEDAERAFMLEEYDRAINNPIADQEAIFKDFLLAAYPKSAKDPDKYIAKQQGQPGMQNGGQAGQPPQPAQAPNSAQSGTPNLGQPPAIRPPQAPQGMIQSANPFAAIAK